MKKALALLILAIFVACTATEEDLIKMGEAKDSESLLEYVEGFHKEESDKYLEKVAIDQIVKNDLMEGKKYLEETVFRTNDRQKVVNILRSYREHGSHLKSLKILLENYLSGYLKFSARDELELLILSYERGAVKRHIRIYFEEYFKTFSDKKEFDNEFVEERRQKINNLMQLAQNGGLITGDDNMNFYLMLGDLIKILKEIDELESNASRITNQIGERQYTIEDNKDKKSAVYPYFPAFIVGVAMELNGVYIYEIALPEYGPGYTQIPSSRHAYYSTTKRFTTKGYFKGENVQVGGSIPVRLKEEFGNFMQNWDVYIELNQNEIDKLKKQDKLVTNLPKEILKYEKELELVKSKIDLIEGNRVEVISSIREILSDLLTDGQSGPVNSN